MLKCRCHNYYQVEDNRVPTDKPQSLFTNPSGEAENCSNPHENQAQTQVLNPRLTFWSWFRRPQFPKFQRANIEAGVEEEENAEMYHFDHGSPSFYRTTDCPPYLVSELIAQHTQLQATKFWGEFFGFINVLVTFFITFFIQFYR